jgi:hypothetical protein
MKLIKRRKCEICEAPVTLVKDFPVTTNLFDTDANPLSGEVLKRVKTWRQRKVYCEKHNGKEREEYTGN